MTLSFPKIGRYTLRAVVFSDTECSIYGTLFFRPEIAPLLDLGNGDASPTLVAEAFTMLFLNLWSPRWAVGELSKKLFSNHFLGAKTLLLPVNNILKVHTDRHERKRAKEICSCTNWRNGHAKSSLTARSLFRPREINEHTEHLEYDYKLPRTSTF